MTRRSEKVAALYAQLARTYAALSAALLEAEATPPPPPATEAHPANKPTVFRRAEAAAAASSPRQRALPVGAGDEPFALSSGNRKILVALAQLGRPLTAAQVGWFARLSSTTGTFTQGLADLRREGLIDGPGSALTITARGLAQLGEFAPLPTGHALFEFWCDKIGGAGAKILRVLRPAHELLSAADVGEACQLSYTTGTFTQALADLRKMHLIEGKGSGLRLTDEFRQALAPTIGVFNTTSGKSVKLDARKGHVT
jgi:hypothetical protein